jgi:beta-N-acetylhexosaminidase
MKSNEMPLIVGLRGTSLLPEERQALELVRPAGVILFARNIESPDQVRALVDSLDDLEPTPFVCIDLEGGAVNRLAPLWGTLPSPARAAAAGRRAVRALGEAAGAACRNLGIHLDLAPVIDLECREGFVARQSRCLSDDPERVATLARVFSEGLTSWCVAGCLKHFPGLGPIEVDTHEELPTLDIRDADLATHVDVFAALSEQIPIVMVGHVIVPALGDSDRPSSLSATVLERAAKLPGAPVVLTDDLEMGALKSWGDLPELVVAAIRARSHGVLVCHACDRLGEIADHIRGEAEADPALAAKIEDMVTRLGTLRRDLCTRSASVPEPDDTTVEQLWGQARHEAEPSRASGAWKLDD